MGKRKEYVYYTDVKEKKVSKTVSDCIRANIEQYEGKRIGIRIAEVQHEYSAEQRKYYFGCVVNEIIDCFRDMWGEIWTKDEVHEYNKANVFYEERVNEKTGEIVKKPGSLKPMGTIDFENAMERCRQYYWLNFEWMIPEPEKQKSLWKQYPVKK